MNSTRYLLAAFLDKLPEDNPSRPAGQDISDLMEMLIDHYGVADLISILSSVCREKAEHVNVAWQDESLFRSWIKVANALDRTESTVRKALPFYNRFNHGEKQ